MKMTVDELIAKLSAISADGNGSLPVWVHKNEAYSVDDVEVGVEEECQGYRYEGYVGTIPKRVFIGPD